MSSATRSMIQKTRNLKLDHNKSASTRKLQKKSPKILQKRKIYTASGQAPSPSKDFFELVVHEDVVIWRKWKIRYAKNGKVIPSQETFGIEKFIDSDILHDDIIRYLGDDVLHMALGNVTETWLPNLPVSILANITSNLSINDICNLRKVCTTLNKRLRFDEIWKFHVFQDFDMNTNKMYTKDFYKLYRAEHRKKKENEIDWDAV